MILFIILLLQILLQNSRYVDIVNDKIIEHFLQSDLWTIRIRQLVSIYWDRFQTISKNVYILPHFWIFFNIFQKFVVVAKIGNDKGTNYTDFIWNC